jgi:hypothetical protein
VMISKGKNVPITLNQCLHISLRQKGAFLSKIPFGCMQGLVKAALTSNPVGFNSVPSAPSQTVPRLTLLVKSSP